MKKLLLVAGAVGILALASYTPAKADAYVDSPSFGRIVYGMTGGAVVLPQDAWQGAYPDGSGTSALPNPLDTAFGGGTMVVGSTKQYIGDAVNAAKGLASPGSDFGIDYAAAVTYNGGSATSVVDNPGGQWNNTNGKPLDKISAIKLGFVASYALPSQIGAYGSDGSTKPAPGDITTVFGANTNAGTINEVVVNNPFAFTYWSNGTLTTPAFDYYSDNPANNSGTSANQLYSHMLAYRVTDVTNTFYDVWFVGFEDTNFNTAGNPGYHRFDFNDSVISMTFEGVPEPAFYQMAGLLTLGAFGLLRMRRRSS